MTETTADNNRKHQMGRIVLLFKRIGYSREPLPTTLRYYLVFVAAVAGIAHMLMWWQSFNIPNLFRKDILQQFLITKSVLGGVDPYLSMQISTDRSTGPSPLLLFPRPTPHLPPLALLSL